MNIESTLKNIGLDEREVQIYLSLLELGEAIPSVIAKRAKIKRTTTYLALERMLEKGIVSKIKKGKYYHFQAVNPHSLLEDQYKRFNDLELILPELLKLNQSYAVRPQVSFFEGKKGLIHIMEDTLKTSTEILNWSDVTLATTSILKDYYPSYISTKLKRGIWVKGICSYDPIALEFQRKGKEELRELALIPKEDFPFKNEINIYDDKVAIISHDDQIGIIIQNKAIADTQRSIFKFAFKYAKKVDEGSIDQVHSKE